MAYTFSRRSFLKYTALSAIALAGASMLSGCEITDPNNPVSTKLGTVLEIHQTQGRLTAIRFDGSDVSFDFSIRTQYENGLLLDPRYFSVMCIHPNENADNESAAPDSTITSYFGTGVLEYPKGCPSADPRLQSGEAVDLRLVVPSFSAQPGDTIVFQYIPVREDHHLSMSWQITLPQELNADSNWELSSSEN